MITQTPGWHREVLRARARRAFPLVAQTAIAIVLSILICLHWGI